MHRDHGHQFTAELHQEMCNLLQIHCNYSTYTYINRKQTALEGRNRSLLALHAENNGVITTR